MAEQVNLWKPTFVLDIKVIDEQHKGFFDLCLSAASLCEAARTKPVEPIDILNIITSMRAYAFLHFHTEEVLLLKYGFPKIYGHISLHDMFLRTLQGFTAELLGFLTTPKTTPEDFLACAGRLNDYLASWWSEHILNADQEYALFIRDCKGRKVGPDFS